MNNELDINIILFQNVCHLTFNINKLNIYFF